MHILYIPVVMAKSTRAETSSSIEVARRIHIYMLVAIAGVSLVYLELTSKLLLAPAISIAMIAFNRPPAVPCFLLLIQILAPLINVIAVVAVVADGGTT